MATKKASKTVTRKTTLAPVQAPAQTTAPLLSDIRALVDAARQYVAQTANATLTMLYWNIGHRIGVELLRKERAPYGQEIVSAVSRELTLAYGNSFSEKNLRRMMQFAEVYPDEKIVVSLIRQLSWTHFIALIPLQDPLQREFYARMCATERWSVRTLRERIGSMLYERTAISRKPRKQMEQELATLRDAEKMTPALLLRDPYLLDFLGLQDTWAENDLEAAIAREMESFLLELGAGFSFVARQKRIQLDDDDFYIDLLFYNRLLRRLVAVELKIGPFKAAYKGQMELYLRWLNQHERQPGEEPPLGIILCTGGKREQIELLELDAAGIHVAQYLTQLPPRELLLQRMHEAETRARELLERHEPAQAVQPAQSGTGKKNRKGR
ncbi:PDDEXK nuclease domain-containing protein [Verminephrobacter eiseniae]|uniref:PDDEXK nuclease domain-containing protein n=1 Tax=Verminephrobacter eiseniae TaxID=364317 RepID=UPI0022376B1E|nr:PDDEXK nuclease domain-containing protein [Verminephrobacter eiseniae]